MIKRTSAFTDSHGKTYATLREAQEAEIARIIQKELTSVPNGDRDALHIAVAVLGQKDQIVDILTTKENSRPERRAVNQGTSKRSRKSKTQAAEQPPSADA